MEKRAPEITELPKKEKAIPVKKLAEIFDVSEMTIISHPGLFRLPEMILTISPWMARRSK